MSVWFLEILLQNYRINKQGPEQIVREEVGGEGTVLETKAIYMERNIERKKRK